MSEGNGDSLQVHTAAGDAKITGKTAIIILAVAIGIAALWFLLVKEISAHDTSMTEKVKTMQDSHRELQDGIDAMVYISSLSDVDKRKLDLREPEKIKRMRK